MDRKKLYVILIVVCTLIVSLTVVYAALSTTLSISGSGSVNASSWDINISNTGLDSAYVNSTTGSATYTMPTITGTTIANYTVSLTKPGDSVTLYFDVNNDGDINGEISEILTGTPVCTSETGNVEDANLVCDNLDVSLTYFNGNAIPVGAILGSDAFCSTSGAGMGIDSIFKVSISLKDTMTSVPSSKVVISNLKHEVKFVQSDKECDPNMIGGL